MPEILADYATACPDCGEWIKVGTPIHLIENTGWVHLHCPDPATVKRAICMTCFTEKAANGSCMCGGGDRA